MESFLHFSSESHINILLTKCSGSLLSTIFSTIQTGIPFVCLLLVVLVGKDLIKIENISGNLDFFVKVWENLNHKKIGGSHRFGQNSPLF